MTTKEKLEYFGFGIATGVILFALMVGFIVKGNTL